MDQSFGGIQKKTSVDFRSVPLLPHMERRPRASLGL